ncbi:hypothetical protein K474DRAFT_1664332 [Panus rudis PR-1116 ss-1]|nr:hypothetical protein K474DRAFT_1664332 [Panus rudis PR-1116 ss-1]
MTSTGTMSLLMRLPPELLHMIKEQIPLTDLRTHVCFYKTTPILAALYGDFLDQRLFWQRACISVGLGAPNGSASYTDWKQVAFTCIEKDGWCSHPKCGVTRLNINAREIEEMELNDLTMNGLRRSMEDVHATGPEYHPYISSLFRYLSFHYSRKQTMEEDALLDYRNGLVDDEENPANLLHEHPIAARSFAIFPVMTKALVMHEVFDSPVIITNPDGITISDVMDGIFECLNDYLSVDQLYRSIDHHDWVTSLGQLAAMDFPSALGKMQTVRQYFYYFRFNGIEFVEWYHEPDDVEPDDVEPDEEPDDIGYPCLSLETRVARITRPVGSLWNQETIAAEKG